jgi:UDP-N-acetylglucosamine/UDP-N-acetylgalactosamine 4-epimerase
MKKNVLITGGAGFIGSNLVEAFVKDKRIGKIIIFDNLSTGNYENIKNFIENDNVEFIEDDIRNYHSLHMAAENIDIICHQAALGSVPRSIKDPITTNDVNITGTLNVFTVAKEKGIKRIVFAASSSTYGDSEVFPRQEDFTGKPLSPYAVTKYVSELYAHSFSLVYDFSYIGLRYFNVFGPKQNINGAYAAVIPKFIDAMLAQKSPIINGDGEQSRDFTYVTNVVEANIAAMFTENPAAINQIYNIGCGESTTVNQLFDEIKSLAQSDILPRFGQSQKGDVKTSRASIEKAEKLLGYNANIKIKEGLKLTYEWYLKKYKKVKSKMLKQSVMAVTFLSESGIYVEETVESMEILLPFL